MAWMGSQKKGQFGWPELAWRNYSQGTFLYLTTASGAVVSTLAASGGIVKAIWSDDYLNGAATLTITGGDDQCWGSAQDFTSWTPCWIDSSGIITLKTATAQLFGVLIGTGLPPFEV